MNAAFREIKAAVTRSKGAPFVIESARIRAPQEDEVLVRIVATGMCHTDMIAYLLARTNKEPWLR